MENNSLPTQDKDGPYKATMLWRTAVRGFRDGMVLQRHWRQLRSYERCFTAQAAVSWLHNYLQQHPSFAADVSRQQTVRLMTKFALAGIIVPVRASRKGNSQFRDDNTLYRLSTHGTPGRSAVTLAGGGCPQPEPGGSPQLRRRSVTVETGSSQQENKPLSQLQQRDRQLPQPDKSPFRPAQPRPPPSDRPQAPRPLQERLAAQQLQQLHVPEQLGEQLPECRPVARQLTEPEVDLVWSNTLLSRLERLLEAPLVDIVPASCVVPSWVRHNISLVNERGLVLPLAQPQPSAPPPLPRWLLLAMKSLANWPMHQAGAAPPPVGDYASFQADVLCVISEYFAALPFPLVPYELHDPLLAAFQHAETTDQQLRQAQQRPAPAADAGADADGASSRGSQREHAQPPLAPASRSVENLLLLMSPGSASVQQDVSSSNPRVAILATPPNTDTHHCRPEEHSVLRARPVPVTPAHESVALLRRRLQQLGVGTTVDVLESEPGPPLQRRPRAASFLMAVTDGRQRDSPPRTESQFCRAVFQPPLGGSAPAKYPRTSSGYVGAPSVDDAVLDYSLPSPITLQPPPPVVPTRLYPAAATQTRSAGGDAEPTTSANWHCSTDINQQVVNPETNRTQMPRYEYGRCGTVAMELCGSRPLKSVAQSSTYEPSPAVLVKKEMPASTDRLSEAHQTSSSSLGIRGLMSSRSSLLSDSNVKSSVSPAALGNNGRGASSVFGRSSYTETRYQFDYVDDNVFVAEPSTKEPEPQSYHLTDRALNSGSSGRTRSSLSSILSGIDNQPPDSRRPDHWSSSGLKARSPEQTLRTSIISNQSSLGEPSSGRIAHRADESLANVTMEAALMSDSAVGSSVTSERPVDVERPGDAARQTDTCLETVFGAAGPVTRLIRQRSVELLHLPQTQSRPGSRLSQATVVDTSGSMESVRGRTALQSSIRRNQLRDDSLSRSVKRLKERRRDKQEMKRRREERESAGSAASGGADYAAFSSGLSHASEDSALAVPVPSSSHLQDSSGVLDDSGLAASNAARHRAGSMASEDGLCMSRPRASKVARLLGVVGGERPPPAQRRGPSALRIWQRRSVADPSRVTQPPLSPLQQAARQRLSVVARDYENISAVSGLLSSYQGAAFGAGSTGGAEACDGAGSVGSQRARPVYHGRFRATPRKRARSPPTAFAPASEPAPAPATLHSSLPAADLETASGHKLARETLQLLLVLLPPSCRRQLQLLLRFMQRVCGNQRLQLRHPRGARQLMLDTFGCRILNPSGAAGSGCGWDASLVDRLLGYLLDHHAEIMAPPQTIANAVQQRVRARQRETVQFSCDGPVTYSNLLSLERYGEEGAATTTQSLLSLLDIIIADTTMPRKEKRKQLKQFRETYPEIYGQRVEEADRELQAAAAGGRRTRSLFSGSLSSLSRSKSLRV